LFTAGLVVVMHFAILRHDGRSGLVAGIRDASKLGAIGYLVIRTGRGWRGAKPPEPSARRATE
jgi:hypothetical protein